MQQNYLEIQGRLIPIDELLPLELNSPFFDRENKVLSNGSSLCPTGMIVPAITIEANSEIDDLLLPYALLSKKGLDPQINNVRLISNGITIDTGNVVVQQVNTNMNSHNSTYSLQFYSASLDNFLQLIKQKKLTELTMGGDIAIPGGGITWVLNADLTLQVNASPPSTPPSPMTYNDVFADDLYSIRAATATFASYIVEHGHDYICFPTLLVYDGNVDDDGKPTFRVINRWFNHSISTYGSVVNHVGNGTYTSYAQRDAPIVPMYFYHQVLKHCFIELGYTLADDWLLQDEQFLKLCFVNTFNITRPLLLYMNNIHNQGTSDYTLYYEQDTAISPKNHLPEITISELLTDFMLKFNCYFEVNGTNVTIRHAEFDKVQREIKNISPEVEIRNDKSGLTLGYSLSGDTYKNETAIKEALTTLPDIDTLGALANGDWYIDHNFNSILEKATGDDKFKGSNLINYNSGSGKVYTMGIVPVNCKVIDYQIVLQGLASLVSGLTHNAFLPFINGTVTGYGTETTNYTWASENGPVFDGLGTSWTLTHTYTFDGIDPAIDSDPATPSIIGFYHGVTSNMDIIGYDPAVQFPYMSFHNYRPGAIVPKIGDWHLGIIGAEGLVETFWKNFINIFTGRKFIIACDQHHFDIKAHRWNRAVIIRGQQLYVSIIRPAYPITQFPVFEAYEL